MNKVYIFIKRGWITFTSYKMEFILNYMSLFVLITIFYFVSSMFKGTEIPSLEKYGGNYTTFIVIGVVFQWFISTSLRSFGSSIRNEQIMGTLEFLLLSRSSLFSILFYSALWSFTRLLLNSMVFFMFAVLIFGISFHINILSVLWILFFSIASLSGIGMMSAGMILLFKQGDPFNWIFATLSGLLSGTLFPIEVMPSFLKSISYLLPTTYALHALRQSLILNTSLYSNIKPIIILISFSLVSIPMGYFIFKWGFNKALIKGNLSQY